MYKVKALAALLILPTLAFSAQAAQSTYLTTQCHNLKGKYKPFILVLKKGQPLNKSITKCLVSADFPGAMIISGIGAVTDVNLAYFNTHTLQYETHLFKSEYELTALSGNFGYVNKKEPALHIHGVIGGRDYQASTGHFVSANIAITGEINILPLHNPVIRSMDKPLKLNLIDPT